MRLHRLPGTCSSQQTLTVLSDLNDDGLRVVRIDGGSPNPPVIQSTAPIAPWVGSHRKSGGGPPRIRSNRSVVLVQRSARSAGPREASYSLNGPDAGVLRDTDKCETHARTHLLSNLSIATATPVLTDQGVRFRQLPG